MLWVAKSYILGCPDFYILKKKIKKEKKQEMFICLGKQQKMSVSAAANGYSLRSETDIIRGLGHWPLNKPKKKKIAFKFVNRNFQVKVSSSVLACTESKV
jgi:hypothetical protein